MCIIIIYYTHKGRKEKPYPELKSLHSAGISEQGDTRSQLRKQIVLRSIFPVGLHRVVHPNDLFVIVFIAVVFHLGGQKHQNDDAGMDDEKHLGIGISFNLVVDPACTYFSWNLNSFMNC